MYLRVRFMNAKIYDDNGTPANRFFVLAYGVCVYVDTRPRYTYFVHTNSECVEECVCMYVLTHSTPGAHLHMSGNATKCTYNLCHLCHL